MVGFHEQINYKTLMFSEFRIKNMEEDVFK